MRICYYIGNIDLSREHGGATHVLEVFESLQQLGHEVILVSSKRLQHSRLNSEYVTLSRPSLARGPLSILGDMTQIIRLGRICKSHRVDLIYARASETDFIASYASSYANVPLVLEVNDPLWTIPTIVNADFIIATAESILVENIHGHKNAASLEGRLAIVTWGCNTEKFRPEKSGKTVRENLRISNKATVLGYVGTFLPWHGVDDLAKASVRVIQKLPEARFVCIGDGGIRAEIEKLVKELGTSESFIFTGQVSHGALPEYLAAADILVAPFNPSKNPVTAKFGFYYTPIKVMEYLASGKPVIATKTGTLTSIIKDGYNGVLIEPGNHESLAEAILSLAREPKRAEELGRNARVEALRNYSWTAHVKMLEQIFREVVSRKGEKRFRIGDYLGYGTRVYFRNLIRKISRIFSREAS